MGLFDKFRKGLEKSRTAVWGRLGAIFKASKLDDTIYDEMEEALLGADVGLETSLWLVDRVRRLVKEERITAPSELPRLLQQAMEEALADHDTTMRMAESGPTVVLVVGVNGAGKTTSIGKLAHHYKEQGKRVLMVAGDTFRAAAIEQLVLWGERVGVEVIRHQQGADPAAVIYDGLAAAKSRKVDVVLCDTAGRLHNKAHLMAELSKITKVVSGSLAGAPHEVLLVVDGTTGQNAMVQAKMFGEAAPLTGIVVTKLDGTAKGGVVLPIVREYGLPVKWVGLGEKMDDLEPFSATSFAGAICGVESPS